MSVLPVETGKDTNTMENMMENTKETAHDAVYWQTYRQVLDEGYDVRVARAEAANAEKRARAAARNAERIRIRAEQNGNEGQAQKAVGKGAKKRSKKSKVNAMQEKGPTASSRVKLFAAVREGKMTQPDAGMLQQQARQKKFF